MNVPLDQQLQSFNSSLGYQYLIEQKVVSALDNTSKCEHKYCDHHEIKIAIRLP